MTLANTTTAIFHHTMHIIATFASYKRHDLLFATRQENIIKGLSVILCPYVKFLWCQCFLVSKKAFGNRALVYRTMTVLSLHHSYFLMIVVFHCQGFITSVSHCARSIVTKQRIFFSVLSKTKRNG